MYQEAKPAAPRLKHSPGSSLAFLRPPYLHAVSRYGTKSDGSTLPWQSAGEGGPTEWLGRPSWRGHVARFNEADARDALRYSIIYMGWSVV